MSWKTLEIGFQLNTAEPARVMHNLSHAHRLRKKYLAAPPALIRSPLTIVKAIARNMSVIIACKKVVFLKRSCH